jgi:hypothetical protein
LFAAPFDRIVKLFDVATGKEKQILKGHDYPISSLAFSPRPHVLAAGDTSGEVLVWDLTTGKVVHRFHGRKKAVCRLTFSGDGSLLAEDDENVHVWEVDSEEERAVFSRGMELPTSLSFSPNGRSLASVDENGRIRIMEISSGRLRREERRDPPFYKAVAWSPDGTLLAYAGDDGTIRFRDARNMNEVASLSGHTGEVTSLAFTADGSRLISSSADTTALIWKTPTHRAAAQPLARDESRKLIAALDGQDAEVAFAGMVRLASSPGVARLAREYLSPATQSDSQHIGKLIEELDSNRFKSRERAMTELMKFGYRARSYLKQVLDEHPTLEMRRRIERVLEADQVGPSPEMVRQERLLELLEMSGDGEAIRVLVELAAGNPDAELTRQAREGLARLKRRV